MKRKAAILLMITGVLLIGISAFLLLYNNYENTLAEKNAGILVEEIRLNIAENELVTNLIKYLRKYDIDIDVIDVTSLLQIELQIEDKYTVLLGKNEHISDKIKHLSSMLDNITDDADIIDLSMWQPDNRQGTTRKLTK